MNLKNLLGKINAAKAAVILLAVYAVLLTGITAATVIFGPLKNPAELWMKNRALTADLRESESANKAIQAEKMRLLDAVKNLRNDVDVQKGTIGALQRTVDPSKVDKNLAKANEMVEKLNKERDVLLAKLAGLRNDLQNIANTSKPEEAKKTAPEMSDLIARLEKERAELQSRVQELQYELSGSRKK